MKTYQQSSLITVLTVNFQALIEVKCVSGYVIVHIPSESVYDGS